ncbi:MAG TPA: cytochrome c oxidase subunit 2A [Trueperaceae bacterium]|nr:cytochrome c oxidase subunit 2A [Trueperaceae bacterium]
MQKNNADSNKHDSESDYKPVGALAIAVIMLSTVLVFWFGIYLLNYVRG